ncbi:MAG TPA: patatin-like phospholipase family protein [Albitalea sp.]
MDISVKPRVKRAEGAASAIKPVNLALQGGGAHGAFAWGVLDRLLEDGRLEVEGISATSAGAMNAAVMAQGLMDGGRDGARAQLAKFWRAVSDAAAWHGPYKGLPWASLTGQWSLDHSPAYMLMDMATRLFSPYQLNPFNFNPLREVLESHVDFAALRERSTIKLYLAATNVETGKVRIFRCADVTADAVLASACLPFMFQAVQIDGEYYWDGGYVGNPAIYPLIYECGSRDVVIVHLNPIVRRGCPRTAAEILNRLNEVSFNSSLMREMRAIAFVTSLIERGKLEPDEAKHMLIHSIRADDEMAELGVSSKLNADWGFLTHLRDKGRRHAERWLARNFDAIGARSSVDIRGEFL